MAVGQEIITYCSSCDLELRHVIVAHKSGNSGPVAKVRCNTCQKIHAYRMKPSERDVARRVERSQAKEVTRVIPIEVEWREQMGKAANSKAVTYSPQVDFKVGDVVDHPTFGSGYVRALKDGNKCEILFQRDVKTLVHRLK